jgi:hypothetical protein
MKFQPSVILSLVSSRMYGDEPITELLGDLYSAATGGDIMPQTHELAYFKKRYMEPILSQCPLEFQEICRNWEHTPDWQDRINMINEAFGYIEIGRCY